MTIIWDKDLRIPDVLDGVSNITTYLLGEYRYLFLFLVCGQSCLPSTDLMNDFLMSRFNFVDAPLLPTPTPPCPASWVPWLSGHLYF